MDHPAALARQEKIEVKGSFDESTKIRGLSPALFAHELVNELSVISSAVQLMEIELVNQHRNIAVMTRLEEVKSGIQRLGTLVNEFQSGARTQTLSVEPTNVSCVMKELLSLEEPRYAARGIRVESEISDHLPRVMLDAMKFRQALLNLCRNAADAMPEGGTLTLRAYSTRSSVRFAVIDTGEGIPPGVDVFALFTTTKPTGSGLGLPIARQIILSHGGTISYSSVLGKGTVFRLRLPVARIPTAVRRNAADCAKC